MPNGIPKGAMCVQRFDDSLNSAIHTTYRISLRSSSMPEPRDPLLKVLIFLIFTEGTATTKVFWGVLAAGPDRPAEETNGTHKQRVLSRWGRIPTVMILPQVHLRNGCEKRKLIPDISEGARPYLKQPQLESPTTIWPVNSIHGTQA